MSVKGLKSLPHRPVTSSTTVEDACRVMFDDRIGAVAVVDDGHVSGVFTYRDLIERVVLVKRDPGTTVMGDVMTNEVDTMTPDDSYADVLRFMVEREYTYMPIVRSDDTFVGMLSLRGLLEHQADSLAEELGSLSQYIAVDGPGGD